jgi:hypothetical protein
MHRHRLRIVLAVVAIALVVALAVGWPAAPPQSPELRHVRAPGAPIPAAPADRPEPAMGTRTGTCAAPDAILASVPAEPGWSDQRAARLATIVAMVPPATAATAAPGPLEPP